MTTDNPTIALIVSRLPKKPLVSPAEISAALSLTTTGPVLDAIADGKIAAAKVGTRYIVAREEAARYIQSLSAGKAETK